MIKFRKRQSDQVKNINNLKTYDEVLFEPSTPVQASSCLIIPF